MVAPFQWSFHLDIRHHTLIPAYDPLLNLTLMQGTFPAKEPQTAIWPRKTNEVTDYTIRCGF